MLVVTGKLKLYGTLASSQHTKLKNIASVGATAI